MLKTLKEVGCDAIDINSIHNKTKDVNKILMTINNTIFKYYLKTPITDEEALLIQQQFTNWTLTLSKQGSEKPCVQAATAILNDYINKLQNYIDNYRFEDSDIAKVQTRVGYCLVEPIKLKRSTYGLSDPSKITSLLKPFKDTHKFILNKYPQITSKLDLSKFTPMERELADKVNSWLYSGINM